jgi:hypothetical protein
MNKYQKALWNITATYYLKLKQVLNENSLTENYKQDLDTLQELVDIVPEYRELKEWRTPKKPIIHYVEMFGTYLVSCPTCSVGLFSDEVIANRIYKARHCANCGQALDWNEQDE